VKYPSPAVRASSRLGWIPGSLAWLLLALALAPVTAGAAWRAGNLFGGGYVDVVRYHPTDANRVLLSTDVGGIHLSTDGGSTWNSRGRYVHDYVASIVWHPTLSNVAYGLAGRGRPGSGGLLISTDSGMTWRMDSTTPTGHSNNTPDEDGLPKPHPRSIGQLLVVDAANGFLYAGTYQQGLMRAPLDAAGNPGTWTTIALAPQAGVPYFIRGIELDDMDPTKLYVATAQSSSGAGTGLVYRIANANSTTGGITATELTGGPRNAEEVRVMAGHLYAVANDVSKGAGAFRLPGARSQAAGTAWRRIAAGPSVTSVTYYGLEVVKRAGVTTMWVASDNTWRPNTTVAHKFLWRGQSSDDFATDGSWVALPDALADTPNDMAGPNATPRPWWKLVGSNYAWPGKDPGYTAGDIAVSPTDVNTVIFAGQGSVWRTRNNGDLWYPVPTGINLLVHARVVADPGTAGRAFLGNVDYRGFGTADAFRSSPTPLGLSAAGAPGSSNDGWSLALDTAASTKALYIGIGTRDSNNDGQIWMDADPASSGSGWTQLLSGTETVLGTEAGNRPIGLAVIRHPASPTVPIVLAVLQGGHMYRKVGSNGWTRVASFTSPIINGFLWPQVVSFAWRPGFNKVYCYDRATGLWRSNDFGATWTRLYTSPDTDANGQGHVEAHPTNENLVYISTLQGVSVVTNAGSAGAGGAVLGSLGFPAGRAGPIAVGADGRIYGTLFPTGTTPSRVYVNKLSSTGTGVAYAWKDISDDLWLNAVTGGRELAVGADGTVYLATGNGVFINDGGETLP